MAEFNQISFIGGMNLVKDDTRLQPNEYREAFNLRNRFDILDQINEALDVESPTGIKQGITTFGDYVFLFVAGNAFFKYRDSQGWTPVPGFSLSYAVPRFWFVSVPVTTTLYAKKALANNSILSANGLVSQVNVAGSTGGLPGLLVQDGVSQPQFIFIDQDGNVQCRTTQDYNAWKYDSTGVNDVREYVPIGTVMEFVDGVLYVVAPDGQSIYRSCSGRPLDFVINVDTNGIKGGDATTTAYSVGVGPITTLRAMNNNSLFVAAGNSTCFSVSKNMTPGAPTEWGEYTLIRQFLFNAGCLSDRCIVDILGDTAFVDLEGLRSFNAVLQTQNEGRNSIFSLKIASLFQRVNITTKKKTTIIQSAATSSAIVYDNYALFSVNTIYGYVILVYDTLNQCWVGMDLQAGGLAIKQFAKIDIDTTRLYAITSDDRVLELYGANTFSVATFRSQSVCSSLLYANMNINMQNPKTEIRPQEFRCVLSRFTQDSIVGMDVFVNNQPVLQGDKRTINYIPGEAYLGEITFSDVNAGVINIVFPTPNCMQGWKAFVVLSWTGGGSITNFSAMLEDLTPMNPLKTQGNAAENEEVKTLSVVLPGGRRGFIRPGFPFLVDAFGVPILGADGSYIKVS